MTCVARALGGVVKDKKWTVAVNNGTITTATVAESGGQVVCARPALSTFEY